MRSVLLIILMTTLSLCQIVLVSSTQENEYQLDNIDVEAFSWSPDGNKIALWESIDDKEITYVCNLDLQVINRFDDCAGYLWYSNTEILTDDFIIIDTISGNKRYLTKDLHGSRYMYLAPNKKKVASRRLRGIIGRRVYDCITIIDFELNKEMIMYVDGAPMSRQIKRIIGWLNNDEIVIERNDDNFYALNIGKTKGYDITNKSVKQYYGALKRISTRPIVVERRISIREINIEGENVSFDRNYFVYYYPGKKRLLNIINIHNGNVERSIAINNGIIDIDYVKWSPVSYEIAYIYVTSESSFLRLYKFEK